MAEGAGQALPSVTIDLPRGSAAAAEVRAAINGAVVDLYKARQRTRAVTVFITAYDQYAVEAFEQGVVDYVLKPAERERLLLTANRIRQRLARRRAVDPAADVASTMVPLQQLLHALSAHIPPASGGGHLRWIQAAVGQTIQMIPVEVLFFVSDEKYTRVQTPKVEALIRKPIKELADVLDPALFWRIHRSTLVNARAIDGITRDLRGRQLVGVKGSGEKLEVSRSYTHLFKGM